MIAVNLLYTFWKYEFFRWLSLFDFFSLIENYIESFRQCLWQVCNTCNKLAANDFTKAFFPNNNFQACTFVSKYTLKNYNEKGKISVQKICFFFLLNSAETKLLWINMVKSKLSLFLILNQILYKMKSFLKR